MALTYVDAGVDQTKKDKAIDRILEMMRRTHDKGVIDLPWGFAGLYSLVSSPLTSRNWAVCVTGSNTINIPCGSCSDRIARSPGGRSTASRVTS